ncbi:MAG: SDR family oxidoreductase [Solirubrobacteraceae bacterium]
MNIAVVGATGRVGRHLVDVLGAGGHDIVAVSRSSGLDVTTGDGLAEALTGVECVIDAASGASPDQQDATEFFTAATRNLHAAGERAGVRRMIVVSIIGCDRFSAGYNAAKLAHEQAMLAGPIPVQVLRAAQFHEFVAQLVDWGREGEVSYVPEMRTQLVAARAVAEALAALATDPDPVRPDGAPIPEIAGPREESLVEMARLLAARRGEPARIEGVSDPTDSDRERYETGGLLPGPEATLAGPTFQEWLARECRGALRIEQARGRRHCPD